MSEKKKPFEPGRGREPFNISETDIRYAMDNSQSNSEAARFLKVHYVTYKKYSEMYFDSDSGKSLFELHKNQAGKGTHKSFPPGKGGLRPIEDIFAGKHPKYPIWKLKNRIIQLELFDVKCEKCGFDDTRFDDDTIPLLLDHIDGNTKNHSIENLRLLCLNCWYINVGYPFKQDREYFWNYNKKP